MLNRIKRIFPHEFRQKLKRRFFNIQDMQTRLANLKRAGFQPTGAIDGGAYQGDWTKTFWSVWPKVPCMLIEPQPNQNLALSKLAKLVTGSQVQQIAIADSDRTERFNLEETNSRLGGDDHEGSIEIEVRRLDSVLAENSDFRPNLLKLDLQGFELAALDGCSERLDSI